MYAQKRGIVADEQEEQEGAQQRGGREGGEGELDQFVGEPVVALLARPPADDLDDHREDRYAEDEGREVQVQLGHRPHGQPRADQREVTVGRFLGRVLRLDRQCADDDYRKGTEQDDTRALAGPR